MSKEQPSNKHRAKTFLLFAPCSLLIVLVLLRFNVPSAGAVVIDPAIGLFDAPSYDQLLIVDYGNTPNSALYFFNTATGLNLSGELASFEGTLAENSMSYPVRVTGPTDCFNLFENYCLYDYGFTPIGSYAAVEVSAFGACNFLSYAACRSRPEFVNEALFSIVLTLPVPGSGGSSAGTTVRTPIVKLASIVPERVSGILEIAYSATDQDDVLGNSGHGLGAFPVSIFSKEVLLLPRGWEQNQPSYGRTGIAEQLPPQGIYRWDTRGVTDGRYQLHLAARGEDNDYREIASDDFLIDNTPPAFVVEAHPAETAGEPVTIALQPTEGLKGIPDLTLEFPDGEEVTVALSYQPASPASPASPRRVGAGPELQRGEPAGGAQEGTFSGTFVPKPGISGLARISVSGMDKAGNIGTRIAGRDTLPVTTASAASSSQSIPAPIIEKPALVPTQPPSAPTATPAPKTFEAPTYTIETANMTASIPGTAPGAVKIVARVNGGQTYETSDLGNGKFLLSNIRLDPDFNGGKNVIAVTAFYPGGKESKQTAFEVLVNSPPQLSLLAPIGRRLVFTGPVKFRWHTEDQNGDAVSVSVELSSDRGSTWTTLARDLTGDAFTWDSTSVPDGANYLFRVTASDGSLAASAVSSLARITNDLPAVLLDADGVFYTSENEKRFEGVVRSKADLLARLEVSMDGGIAWRDVPPVDGAWDGAFERFAFVAPALKEGFQNIVLRGTSVSGRRVRTDASMKVFFDDRPPTVFLEALERPPLAMRGLRLSGTALDDTAGISRVEYAVDGGDWYRAQLVIGKTPRSARFAVDHSVALADGGHMVSVRGIDRAGNVSVADTVQIDIDATPPRLAGISVSRGNGFLYPRADGTILVSSGDSLQLQFALGRGAQSAVLSGADIRIDLMRDAQDGLWHGALIVPDNDPIALSLHAEDVMGNALERPVLVFSTQAEAVAAPHAGEQKLSLWQRIKIFFSSII